MTSDQRVTHPIQIRGCRKCGASLRVETGAWECPHCGELYDDPEFEVTSEPGLLCISLKMPGENADEPEDR